MTIADLIRKLRELDLDPDTPVRFFANCYDANDDPLIEIRRIGGPKRGKDILAIEIESEDIQAMIEEQLEEW